MLLRPQVFSASAYPEALSALHDLLADRTALLPLPSDWRTTHPDLPAHMQADDPSAPIAPGSIVVSTSGSTGTPKGAILTTSQLDASNAGTFATIDALTGGRLGPWLLALPLHHIAGIQVMVRSLRTGFPPLLASHLSSGTAFTVEGFLQDVSTLTAEHPGEDLYTSLVPTQLERLATDPRAVAALAQFTAILVGGAATRPSLLEELRACGVALITTYGSSETAGGAVYNGHPIPGATVRIDSPDDRGAGLVTITGPMVAEGYRNLPGHPAFPVPGTFATSDIGFFSDATLRILGRADGAVNSGGYKVLPEEVERVLADHIHGITAAAAVGVDDRELGQAIWAAVEFTPESTPGADLPLEITNIVRDTLRGHVPKHLNPRRVWAVGELPRIGPGKVDRRAVATLLRELGGDTSRTELTSGA